MTDKQQNGSEGSLNSGGVSSDPRPGILSAFNIVIGVASQSSSSIAHALGKDHSFATIGEGDLGGPEQGAIGIRFGCSSWEYKAVLIFEEFGLSQTFEGKVSLSLELGEVRVSDEGRISADEARAVNTVGSSLEEGMLHTSDPAHDVARSLCGHLTSLISSMMDKASRLYLIGSVNDRPQS